MRQFVLRTRSDLLFTPFAYTFQIQVNYSVDDIEHTAVVPYSTSIRAGIGATVAGATFGAMIGSVLKSLTGPGGLAWPPLLRGAAIALLASVAVVVAFARKSNAQPLVTIEDFWGGALIGFSVGYFGFQEFSNLLKA